ncbi:histidine kinase [Actinomycetospora lutea]|uniref:sensor histidine kinase n=1 Tax=Actinomycetospora lutea TaxID=663604 RepID=UPI00236614D4|nr:ATP-binding protein [Actinomycetospora lutea]MDD7941058.1 histidine kinase [Actinomycetospora lutea]
MERDLHDGAQQQLVLLRINPELAAEQIEREQAGGSEQLRALGEDIDRVLDEIRNLAAGIFPRLLADAGLGEALAAAARRGPIHTTVDTVGVGRYPLEVETAVYFCCLEALQNSIKHARGASAVTMRVVDDGALLRLEVTDDGIGFDPPDPPPTSTGVTNMKDRLGNVGGRLWIESAPGSGTVVRGDVPTDGVSGACRGDSPDVT